MLEVDEALSRVLDSIAPLGTESVPYQESLHRVAAEDILVTRPQPPFANSAMDGYAVRAGDIDGDGPFTLNVVAESAAGGTEPISLGPKEAARIFTGGPMPRGADAVIIQEDVIDGVTRATPKAGDHVRRAGVDLESGQPIVRRGEVIGIGELANLATQGVLNPRVFTKPRVAILCTGDELVEAGPKPGFGQITNSSAPMIAGAISTYGALPIPCPAAPDDLERTKEAIANATRQADLLVVTGGMSVGDYDFAAVAMQELGTVAFHTVRMKPGKPLAFGTIEQTAVLGLPGNPVSSFVGLELFGRPAIRGLGGYNQIHRPRIHANLACDVRRNRNRPEYIRGRFEGAQFHPFRRQGSNDLSSVIAVEGLALIDAGEGSVHAGAEVVVFDLRRAQ
ncbi:MAG: gephyrin-like molybdotransferase Glp [Myxococcota bacterium]